MNIIIIRQLSHFNCRMFDIGNIMAVIKFNKRIDFNKVKNPSLIKTSGVMKINSNFIFFSKFELTSILNLYSKQVSKGFWKDYALDSKVNTAIFSIYKHSHDRPIYQIIKKSLKGFRNMPDFFIIKDTEIINKSSEISIILSKFEKKLSIRKYS